MIKKVVLIRWLTGACVLAVAAVTSVSAAQPPDTLEFALIMSRHGIRSSLYKPEVMATYASRPWPAWEVAPGLLTPQGGDLVAQMGSYYRQLYRSEGLLTGRPAEDAARLYIKADNDQRTVETARRLGLELLNGTEAKVDALPAAAIDPLFQPLRVHKFVADYQLGAAAVLGRIGGDPTVIERAYAQQFRDLKTILYGKGGEPADSPFHETAQIVPGEWDNLVKLGGPLHSALVATESLLLEYVDGKPAQDVGWGEVDGKTLTELLELHELYFDLSARTFYPAQVQGSNLAAHILATIDQAASGQPVAGAMGKAGQTLVVVAGHDTNLANLGGLLGMNWWIAGSQMNPVFPGSALTFELWKHGDDGKLYVRLTYVGQTLEQMRRKDVLTLAHPPARSPIFLAAHSGPGPNFDIPLDSFEAAVRTAVNPAFVIAGTP